eukprot:jgi/Psemu1/3023/gm1.3023_g
MDINIGEDFLAAAKLLPAALLHCLGRQFAFHLDHALVLQSAIEIKWINKELEHEHDLIKIHQWENKLTAIKLKTRKPCKKPTQERQIACYCAYCHNIHCMLENSRGVCYCCHGYIKDGKDLPMNQTSTACKCEVCLCKCDSVFLDGEKAAAGGASAFLSYVEGKIDSRVNEQYLANPFAIKANHLQNGHATAFLDIIRDPVLGSARVKKTVQEAMGPLQTTSKDGKTINQLRDEKRGVKSKPSSDSQFHCNKLSLAPMDPTRFLCNQTLKKSPIKTQMNTPLKIGSYHEPITINGDTEDSKPRPWALIHTLSRNQEPPKDRTPAFVWYVHCLTFKKADFQMNSQDTQDILEFMGPKLTYKDDSEVAVNMKVCVLDHGESGKEAAESLSSVIKWCKQVQVHKQQKVQKEDD